MRTVDQHELACITCRLVLCIEFLRRTYCTICIHTQTCYNDIGGVIIPMALLRTSIQWNWWINKVLIKHPTSCDVMLGYFWQVHSSKIARWVTAHFSQEKPVSNKCSAFFAQRQNILMMRKNILCAAMRWVWTKTASLFTYAFAEIFRCSKTKKEWKRSETVFLRSYPKSNASLSLSRIIFTCQHCRKNMHAYTHMVITGNWGRMNRWNAKTESEPDRESETEANILCNKLNFGS